MPRNDVEATARRITERHCLKNDDRVKHWTMPGEAAGCTCTAHTLDIVVAALRARDRRAVRKVRLYAVRDHERRFVCLVDVAVKAILGGSRHGR
jgi:hypothetical protein